MDEPRSPGLAQRPYGVRVDEHEVLRRSAFQPLVDRPRRGCGAEPDNQVRRVLAASNEILDECIRLGGSVTGEHGIGVEKIDFMPKLFTPEDLAMMLRLRQAFNPEGRCSPHKMLPTAGACIEQSKVSRRAAL